MRGLTFYFGHYPSEAEMWQMVINGEELALGWQFWVYFSVMVVTFIASSIWQIKYRSDDIDAGVAEHYTKG